MRGVCWQFGVVPGIVVAVLALAVSAGAAEPGAAPASTPDEPAARFHEPLVLFAPSGPLLIRAELYLDGKPYAEAQRDRITAIYRTLDADADGRVTWSEVAVSPRFLPGMFTFRFGAEGLRPDRLVYYARFFRRKFDTNENGELDLPELLAAHQQSYTTPRFVTTSSIMSPVANQMLELLDLNKDGALSAGELAAVQERLASRDRNANELVEFAELSAPAPAVREAATGLPVTTSLLSRAEGSIANWQAQLQSAILIERAEADRRARELNRDPRAQDRARDEADKKMKAARMEAMQLQAPEAPGQRPSDDELHAQGMHELWRRYYAGGERLTADRMPALASRFSELDADGDLKLSQAELTHAKDMTPHVVLKLDLSSRALRCSLSDVDAGRFDPLTPAAIELDDATGVATVRERSFMVRFMGQRMGLDSLGAARAFVAKRDTNKSGTLDRNEFQPDEEMPAWTFALWDGDQNGKVTPEEIDFMAQFSLAPFDIYLAGRVADQPLLQMLDASGDARLSLREMRMARQRLLTLDLDGNGVLSPDEMPRTINLEASATRQIGQFHSFTPIFADTIRNERQTAGPDWFVRMDRNGDGDVSEREFLGGPDKFRQLDTNGDGLIEPAEAE